MSISYPFPQSFWAPKQQWKVSQVVMQLPEPPWCCFSWQTIAMKRIPSKQPISPKKNNTQSEEEVVSIGRNQLLQFPYLGGSFDEKWWQQQDMQKQNHQNTPFKMSWVASKTSWKWFTTSLKKWKVVKELKNPFGVMIDLRASLFGMDGSPFSMRVANPPSKVPSRSKVFAILFGLRVKNFVFVAH